MAKCCILYLKCVYINQRLFILRGMLDANIMEKISKKTY